jgi:hypothetical protein
MPESATTQDSTFENTDNQDTKSESRSANSLRGILGDGIKLPELDADTVILLILVYFLLGDDDSTHISDTILIIGALLLLGF